LARVIVISLEAAQAQLIALATPVPVKPVPLLEAAGRWATEDVVAKRTQPAHNLSAMDGYAIAHADLPGPWTLVGESAAGDRFAGPVARGGCARIFTGAALPPGTDSVIMQEDVTRDGDIVRIADDLNVPQAQHVRAAGSDFLGGSILIKAGDPLTPAAIAIAAMGGYGALPVCRKISVDILSTGNELVAPGEDVRDDQIPNSNGVMIGAMLRDWPCDVRILPVARDTMEATTEAIRSSTADILVTCGGASVGDHDLVRPALIECGAEIDFWKVAMRPGKPVMAGKHRGRLVIGLPGNPVSAYVTALLFLRPLIAALGGAGAPLPKRERARLDCALPANGPRTDHLRARRVEDGVTSVGLNDSAALQALSRSDVLIVRPPGAPAAKIGDQVEILSLA
jgi:molybdopterin molybdotransferase